MKTLREYLNEKTEKKNPNILKQSIIKGLKISTAFVPVYNEYETMVFEKYPNTADEWDYDGIFQTRTKSKEQALIIHDMVESLVKSGKIK